MATTTELLTTSIDYFESIYAEAAGDPDRIPWAHRGPNPALVNWLNAVAPSLVRCGARVAMVGCGLGEDAREVMSRGYEVTGFDCSPTAIKWARSLDPDHVEGYVQADLFNPPPRWAHRFDLVVEINNIESLSPDRVGDAVRALENLLTPHGRLLVIGRVTDTPVPVAGGPPWPLTEAELLQTTADVGLIPDGPVCSFLDDEDPPVRRIRAVFGRRS
ncbi:MAG: methyltransferase domain-containing protein [Planctomycetes bacterium]|nr:methyltransferase domain-containing protein [Planctomycetota bacterium]